MCEGEGDEVEAVKKNQKGTVKVEGVKRAVKNFASGRRQGFVLEE